MNDNPKKGINKSIVWGWIIIAASFCFGFGQLLNIMNANAAGLGDIALLVAYFGMVLLWGIFGATLVIVGVIRTTAIAPVRNQSHQKEVSSAISLEKNSEMETMKEEEEVKASAEAPKPIKKFLFIYLATLGGITLIVWLLIKFSGH